MVRKWVCGLVTRSLGDDRLSCDVSTVVVNLYTCVEARLVLVSLMVDYVIDVCNGVVFVAGKVV